MFKQEIDETIINSMAEEGMKVVYFPELERYFVVERFEPSDAYHGKEHHEVYGKDISYLLQHYSSNMQNKYTMQTKVDSLKNTRKRFHHTYKWIWILE